MHAQVELQILETRLGQVRSGQVRPAPLVVRPVVLVRSLRPVKPDQILRNVDVPLELG